MIPIESYHAQLFVNRYREGCPKISIRKEWNGKGLGRQRSWKSLFPIFLCRALEERRTRILLLLLSRPWRMIDAHIKKDFLSYSPHKKIKHFNLLIYPVAAGSSGIPEDMMKIFKTTNLGSIIGARRKTEKKKSFFFLASNRFFYLPTLSVDDRFSATSGPIYCFRLHIGRRDRK